MNKFGVRVGMQAMVLAIILALTAAGSSAFAQGKGFTTVEREVRHELVLIPNLTVFDNLVFSVNGGVVTLSGQVHNPTIKTEAERVVKGVDGVTQVVNNLQVLPLSSNDDQIREAEYRAIYGYPTFYKYAQGALAPIRIIVSGGHVVLEGFVANAMDRELAEAQARKVPGVFSVTNNLQLDTRH
jgi:hyperosmotically inducible protein